MKNKGFTLVEILIGIIIIGVLAGIAIPVYQTTIENTQKREATSNLRSIHAAEKIYHMDEGEFSTSLVDLNINISSAHDKYFDYTLSRPRGEDNFLAIAQRIDRSYYLSVDKSGQVTEHEGSAKTEPVGIPLVEW